MLHVMFTSCEPLAERQLLTSQGLENKIRVRRAFSPGFIADLTPSGAIDCYIPLPREGEQLMAAVHNLYDRILRGVAGPSDTAGIRIRATYAPAAGDGSKIYPPTFPVKSGDWKRYLVEKRFTATDGPEAAAARQTVLTDSIQSQGNRWEEAVQEAIDAGELSIPVLDLVFDFDGHQHHITNLVAPHRAVDAYFRDAERDGTAWETTELGQSIVRATPRTARSLYQQVPTDLILGHWDSQRGTQRARKVARAYTSEMIGLDPQLGRSAAVRVDPFEISSAIKVAVPKGAKQADWELVGESKTGTRPSEVNLGNAFSTDDADQRSWVGTAVSSVERVAFISFAALQRFSFPETGAAPDRAVDAAGRAVLAALALYGDRRAFAGAGLFLRSGCDLVLVDEQVGFVAFGNQLDAIDVNESSARELVQHAVAEAANQGLTFGESIALQPKQKLRDLVEQSMARASIGDD